MEVGVDCKERNSSIALCIRIKMSRKACIVYSREEEGDGIEMERRLFRASA